MGLDNEWLILADLNVQRGKREFRKRVWFTNAAYGPVMVIAWWDAHYADPIYLVSKKHVSRGNRRARRQGVARVIQVPPRLQIHP